MAGSVLGHGLSIAGGAFGLAANLAISAIIAGMCFFFFSWHFHKISCWPAQFIPIEHRQLALSLIGDMNAATRGFIRGRDRPVWVIGYDGDFTHVRLGDTIGWIPNEDLRVGEPAPQRSLSDGSLIRGLGQ